MNTLNTVALAMNLSRPFSLDTTALPAALADDGTLSTQSINTVMYGMVAQLVRDEACTPKQALATAIVFTENLDRLIKSGNGFAQRMVCTLDDTTINSNSVEAFDVLAMLCEYDYIVSIIGTNSVYIAGDATFELLDRDNTSYAPVKFDQPIERRRNYASIETSDLTKEAIHTLESVPVMKSVIMEKLAVKVFSMEMKNEVLLSELYVIKGVLDLEEETAYHTEFNADTRGRLYQTACYGFNGQSSDLARSLQDLHGVSMDYDTKATMALLVEEMEDMGSWDMSGNKADFRSDYLAAVKSPVNFILANLKKADGTYPGNVKKVWNFTKFAMLVRAISRFDKGLAPKPYVGVAVGFDAKCSGPQLGALMVSDETMLSACGFSQTKVNDAYHNAIVEVEAAGLEGFARGDVKKPFMAIFYGAGVDAMMNIHTIESGAYNLLYTEDMTSEEMKEVATIFHKAIVKSFGKRLNSLRKKIKSMGYDREAMTSRYATPVRHRMPDGQLVSMDYKETINIDGDVIDRETPAHFSTIVDTGTQSIRMAKLAFKTSKFDVDAYARTGFVNMIQATDALMARLIIVHARKLGAKHIISIHDCFRVSITDTALLTQAIKNAYMELFGSDTNEPTEHMPLGTDTIGLYFEGAAKSVKAMYANVMPKGSQFFGKDMIRRTDEVNGVSMKELISDLGEEGTYYFAK